MTEGIEPPAEGAGGSSSPRRIRLRPSVEVFPASTGELFLMAPGEPHLVVRAPDPADRAVLARLERDSATLGELAEHLTAEGLVVREGELESKVSALLSAGVARYEAPPAAPLEPAVAARFDRQLPYFAERGEPGAIQRSLGDARVVVLGCGGLGTWVLGALAAAGVGEFVLIDADHVELSNLNRQILYPVDAVGGPKVEAARAWVERFDPSIRVRTVARYVRSADDLAPLLAGATVLVQAADQPAYDIFRWVDEACLAAGVPFITSGQYPPLIKVGPTYIPGVTACYECHERALRREFPLYEELAVRRQARHVSATTLGPASGLVGTMVALEVMHLLAGFRPLATEGRTLLLDMATFETRWETIDRDPDCPRCRDVSAPG